MRAIPVTLLLSTHLALALDLKGVLDSLVSTAASVFPFEAGFDAAKVAQLAESLPSHSWEYGATAQALLELYDPPLSVFSPSPFPVPVRDPSTVRALKYAAQKIILGHGADGLSPGDGAVGDPASLGVSAVMLGKTDGRYATAAKDQIDYMLHGAPRFWNGAISQRADVPELWADFMYMGPPFISYYAVDTNDSSLLHDSVELCGNYRQVLKANITSKPYDGVWEHIIGPQSVDHGLWATGNGWAAGGMARVLATVARAPTDLTQGWRDQAISNLTTWIKEIIDGAKGAPMDNGLLRNYLDNTWEDGHGFGEISGSSMLASVVYRMAVMRPELFGSTYIAWADGIRKAISGNDYQGLARVTVEGIVQPAVNPLGWLDTNPFVTGSPEGQAFVILMYAAWRDCIDAGKCPVENGTKIRRHVRRRAH
ncbi:Six-hairpin glycosidase [Marasmius fiardii PR-910]|nr:Six-hairpin glycosidase [Marasmius fiardii PR-910]